MDITEQLIALYALQQLDDKINILKRQYAAIDTGAAEQAAVDAASAAHKEADVAQRGNNALLKDLELEQKAVEAKRAEYETRLYSGAVRNPKELQAINDEVEMLGRQRALLDEKLLVLMDALDGTKTRLAQASKARTEARARLKEKVAGAKHQSDKLAIEARSLLEKRKVASAAVLPEMLKKYDLLRIDRGGIAIAPIEDANACGACRMALPANIVRAVRLGIAIQSCPNCHRLLTPHKAAA